MRRRLNSYNWFDFLNIVILAAFTFICFYPLWTVAVAAFSDGKDYLKGGVFWWPRVLSLENFTYAFGDPRLFTGMRVSALRALVGTVTHLFFTAMVAYGMTLKDIKFKNVTFYINLFTMFFGGGLIPFFLLLKSLRLINSFWVYIIPGIYGVYNMIIISNFFRDLPPDLHESAEIDGASEFRTYVSLYLPLSKPVLATVALWVAVGHWNSFFDSMIYTTDINLQTIQLFLVKLIRQAESMMRPDENLMTDEDRLTGVSYATIRYAAMFIACVPILCVYPFLQRYFTKGIMLGSLKG